jgi:hypothetical protein
MKLRLYSTVLAVLSIVGTMSVASGASGTPKPYAQMKTAIADADAELSVRATTTASMSGMRIVQVTDAGRSAGRQVVTLTDAGKSNTFVAELIAGSLYVKGDLGLSQPNSNALAGQWFGIPKSSGYYAQVAQGLTVSTGMAEVTMTPSLKESSATISGVKVNVLKGMSVKTSLEPSYKETFYFSTAKKPLPVEVTQRVSSSLGKILFSDWNEKITLVAPKVTLHLN